MSENRICLNVKAVRISASNDDEKIISIMIKCIKTRQQGVTDKQSIEFPLRNFKTFHCHCRAMLVRSSGDGHRNLSSKHVST
jgi:hypothetical protein